MSRRSWMTVAVVTLSTIASGCRSDDYGPLHEYNDVWRGQISLDDGPSHTVELGIYVNEHDAQQAVSDRFLWKTVYGLLSLDHGEVLVAGVGDASHWDLRTPGPAYSPVDGQEFVYLRFNETVSRRGGSNEPSPTYEEDYERFLEILGGAEDRGEIAIAMERTENELTGILRETGRSAAESAADPSTDSDSPRLGEASLFLLEQDRRATFPDAQTVLREPFEFQTVVHSPDSLGFAIRRMD